MTQISLTAPDVADREQVEMTLRAFSRDSGVAKDEAAAIVDGFFADKSLMAKEGLRALVDYCKADDCPAASIYEALASGVRVLGDKDERPGPEEVEFEQALAILRGFQGAPVSVLVTNSEVMPGIMARGTLGWDPRDHVPEASQYREFTLAQGGEEVGRFCFFDGWAEHHRCQVESGAVFIDQPDGISVEVRRMDLAHWPTSLIQRPEAVAA